MGGQKVHTIYQHPAKQDCFIAISNYTTNTSMIIYGFDRLESRIT